MGEFFLNIINMSISASWIVLAVLLLRLLLKKAPKWITVLLWGIVAVRLICPFTIESVMSLIPSAETISPEIMMDATPEINSGVPFLNDTINPIISESFAPDPAMSANPLQILIPVLSTIWLMGVAGMLLYTVISYFRVRRKIGTAVLLRDNIFQSESVVSPFVLGIVKPRIYLPFYMNEQDMSHVIAHEQVHIRRKDHWWKPFGFLILALHWFNPLIWLGYILLCRDIEFACDEKVIKELNPEQKADYSQTILACSINRRIIAACPLAFGEVGVKKRVKSVLNYKKPTFWIVLIAIVASVIVAICFLTNPKQDTNLGISSQKSGSDLNGVSLKIVDANLSALDPYIEVEWTNDTNKKITFGQQFQIFYNQKGTWENCNIEEPVWHLIAHSLDTKSTSKYVYKLGGQNMTRIGKYRFEVPFTAESAIKYKAWIEFELEEGVKNRFFRAFKPIELVYDDGMYSFVQTADNAPAYLIANGMQLFEKSISEKLRGTFEEITISKESFDSRFRGNEDYSWMANDTLKSLKDNNRRIWQLYGDSDAETPYLYLLLEQRDGTFYIGYGYYNCNSINPTNSDDSHIRWLYRLEEISISNVNGTDGTVNTVGATDIEQLKAKFPSYFGLSSFKGLEVYIWQMAEGSYSCGLLPGRNLTYTQEELWELHKSSASLSEMRAIIADYMVNGNVSKSDILIRAIVMPHSSYFYTIDDEYRRELNELFWSEIPIVKTQNLVP